jgi:predicted ArsR family transcriptional regulator
MSEQPSLWDVPPPRARRTDPVTSHLAAASMIEGAASQRAAIVRALKEHGPMTANEMDRMHGWRDATAGRRLSELREAGAVVADGTRLTESGRSASLYRLVKPLNRRTG